jgi:hypothetical protein
MSISKKIKLVDLLVNTENYRFEPVASQKEAINLMIEDQNEKLFRLAEHIVHHGLNPNDMIQVSPSGHDGNKFNVLEGNRRIVCLKILNNPDLIEHSKYQNLKKKFKNLSEGNKNKIIKEIDCIVYSDPLEADKWIRLKHTGQSNGVGTVDWDAQQVQRFDEKVDGKSSVSLQVINLLKSNDQVPMEIKNNLPGMKVTNLDRLISDPDIRNFLGIDISNGIIRSETAENEVVKGLIQIAYDLLDVDFSVKKIYTKDDRKTYISKFPKKSTPKLDRKAEKPWDFITTVSEGNRSSKKPTSKKTVDSYKRKHLIPKKCILNINNPKLGKIYQELQKIDVSYCNAVGILFRVFIELSLDCFIEANGLTNVNINSKLIAKVRGVADYLEENHFADKYICKGIRNSCSNANELLGIDTWNAYVHNPRFSPLPENLLVTWDNIQTFIEKVWENIK